VGSFDTDFEAVDDMFAEAFGGTVSIHRSVYSATGVIAEAVSVDYEVFDNDGLVTVVNARDYVIAVEDYTVNGEIADPLAGDLIKESIDGTTHVFQVLPVGSRPAREWLGNQRPQWLVHTKLIGTE
jgi:hypothetical protein